MRVADLGATSAGSLAVAAVLWGNQACIGEKVADAGEAVAGVVLVQQHVGQDISDSGDRS